MSLQVPLLLSDVPLLRQLCRPAQCSGFQTVHRIVTCIRNRQRLTVSPGDHAEVPYLLEGLRVRHRKQRCNKRGATGHGQQGVRLIARSGGCSPQSVECHQPLRSMVWKMYLRLQTWGHFGLCTLKFQGFGIQRNISESSIY